MLSSDVKSELMVKCGKIIILWHPKEKHKETSSSVVQVAQEIQHLKIYTILDNILIFHYQLSYIFPLKIYKNTEKRDVDFLTTFYFLLFNAVETHTNGF